ncbi:hypothetical protein CJO81_03160 [Ralstonia solanacearum]|uniref:hypothetical protein n=1 Tax=Ralstonia pseudosolanacearum TaxID=1310165 RepID=UPI000E5885AB|nr:hypothetical protein [Ralstonia pseudosolanacearum]AXV99843.1 hypothetical protein CJO81_03160 [Ralstonia solanacearum]AXW27333.1 hypothetical protein CJO87_03155 [Ralstonia solanacearum]AXW32323.1 hypothetical protein CJO88_02650 [Ralstonia solanacearum]NJZ70808.1 hypothetical protein [Ralstonia solanacearum]NJZ83730.1 hypothetical protein [Ralstonia solanacearum]
MNFTTATGQQTIDEQSLFDALEALRPSKHDQQKRAFEKVYPQILKKLSEGIKESDIIKVLSVQGILRSRNTYAKWMAEMAAQAAVTEPSVVRHAMQRASAGSQA